MRLRVLCASLVAAIPAALSSQTRDIPIRQLGTANVAQVPFTNAMIGAAELSGGRIVLRDNISRRLYLFDSTLTKVDTIADPEGKSGAFYPNNGFASLPLAYRGDTALLIDLSVPGFVAITPDGKVGTTMSHPVAQHLTLGMDRQGAGIGFDNLGRFIYRLRRAPPTSDKVVTGGSRDTMAVVRADFDKRTVDTIGYYGIPVTMSLGYTTDPSTEQRIATQTINPYPMGLDAWAILSNGTVGVVRAQDYHVDWIATDGKKSSSAKLPFDWREFSQAEKIARTDSMKRIIDSVSQLKNSPYGRAFFNRRDASGRVIGVDTVKATIHWVTPAEMPDYLSPISENSVKADRDGNLFILPTTTLRARGGLLYDVVNEKAGLHERVQLPQGCNIAGFGKGSTLLLVCGEGRAWRFERRRIMR